MCEKKCASLWSKKNPSEEEQPSGAGDRKKGLLSSGISSYSRSLTNHGDDVGTRRWFLGNLHV